MKKCLIGALATSITLGAVWACSSSEESGPAVEGTDGGRDAAGSKDSAAGGGDANDAEGPDARTDGGDAGTSTFQIGAMPGLVLWLDATKITFDGGAPEAGAGDAGIGVGVWADQSPAKNDATQSIASLRPRYAATAINGKPALHFSTTGGNKTLETENAASLAIGKKDFVFAYVFRAPKPTVDGRIATNVSGLNALLLAIDDTETTYLNMTLNAHFGFVMASKTKVTDDAPHLTVFYRHGVPQAIDVRVDGVLDKTSKPADNGDADSDMSGASGNIELGYQLTGDLAEFVFVSGTAPPADVVSLEGVLKSKWGL